MLRSASFEDYNKKIQELREVDQDVRQYRIELSEDIEREMSTL
jgi:hypothetical protein